MLGMDASTSIDKTISQALCPVIGSHVGANRLVTMLRCAPSSREQPARLGKWEQALDKTEAGFLGMRALSSSSLPGCFKQTPTPWSISVLPDSHRHVFVEGCVNLLSLPFFHEPRGSQRRRILQVTETIRRKGTPKSHQRSARASGLILAVIVQCGELSGLLVSARRGLNGQNSCKTRYCASHLE
jgi:hypothetical protein